MIRNFSKNIKKSLKAFVKNSRSKGLIEFVKSLGSLFLSINSEPRLISREKSKISNKNLSERRYFSEEELEGMTDFSSRKNILAFEVFLCFPCIWKTVGKKFILKILFKKYENLKLIKKESVFFHFKENDVEI